MTHWVKSHLIFPLPRSSQDWRFSRPFHSTWNFLPAVCRFSTGREPSPVPSVSGILLFCLQPALPRPRPKQLLQPCICPYRVHNFCNCTCHRMCSFVDIFNCFTGETVLWLGEWRKTEGTLWDRRPSKLDHGVNLSGLCPSPIPNPQSMTSWLWLACPQSQGPLMN